MGKVTLICVFLVFALLLEDGSSIKKTEKEDKEDEEVARAVNATLAEEERKRKEEEDEKKRQLDLEKKKENRNKTKKEGDQGETTMKKNQDEACVTSNITCPVVDPCPEEKTCPPCQKCPDPEECPEVDPCQPCGPCPPVKPCKPCEQVNPTDLPPANNTCPEGPGMSVPLALVVGACAGGLLTGVAALLGLLLRYFSPLECGFVFLATIIIVWYLCSHYPDTARELGGRAANLLREAAVAVSHRVMEAIRRHQEQVGVPSKSIFLLK
jgi:hypothetical protein